MNTEGVVERLRELAAAKVPFVHQGRTFSGIDCVGAVAYAFQYDHGLPNYPEDPINGELEKNLTEILGPPVLEKPASVSLLKPLDILSMQYAGPVRHVAVVVPHINIKEALSIVHTHAIVGHVIEHILDEKWRRRIVRVWRV